MKKTLMGTTALVAAAVAVSGARADEMMAEPISLTIGGNSHWGVAVVDNEASDDTDDIAISNDVELQFKGSTVLDSGIEIGIRIEIEGEQSSDQGDETYAYLEGSFGTLRIGNDDAAAAQMGTAAPYATYFYGLNTPYWAYSFGSAYEDPDELGHSQTWMSTFAGSGIGDSASIMYFSPVINGFQFGISYAPEAGVEARSATASMAEGHDAVSVGARYDGAFGDAGVTVAAGYMSKDVPAGAPTAAMITFKRGELSAEDLALVHAAVDAFVLTDSNVNQNPVDEDGNLNFDNLDGDVTAPTAADDAIAYTAAKEGSAGRTVTDWAAGVVVSMSGVSVGGSYRNTDMDDNGDDLVQYDVGIMYGEGPWAVSINVGNASQEDKGLDTDFARLLANYNIGPGINLAGAIGSDSPDSGNDTTFAGIALGISF